MNTTKKSQSIRRKLIATLLIVATALMALGNPASASPQGFIEEEAGVGYFYGSFGETPNVLLLVGGTAQEFCEASEIEGVDPFDAEPGIATQRVFLRSDGSVDVHVNDKDQPIHLYYTESDEGAPPWIGQVCAGDLDPEPFASGLADLKVRVSVLAGGDLDIFNSVNGKATGTDGTEYKVWASADLAIEDGMPVGDPEDFVSFDLKEIRR